jgi:two-component sensor histidine kinase
MAECYAALGRYSLAEQYYLQAVKKAEEVNDSNLIWNCYAALGAFYLLAKQYDKARFYVQQTLQRHEHAGIVLGQANEHLRLFAVDSAQGRLLSAIGHYQQYKLLTDSVFNEAKSKQLAALQVQHDTRRKEQDIALLTKQALVQQARLRQREWQRNALLIGAGGLVLLLGLGVNRYRLKQRVNRLLQAQQQEIHRKNAALEAVVGDKQRLLEEKEGLLEEKGWMLKEIHHRVKNNLQIISSLLSTQVDFLRDPAALAALRESQNRVQAMALVHQKLYQSDNLALVDMQAYIADLTEHLLESFDCQGTVRAQLHVAPARLDIALATPLGLILNEAITNALKHAFPPGRTGTLTVALRPLEAPRWELRIADDGVGLPPGAERRRHESLGLAMIEGLSKQIGGALQLAPAGGGGVQLTLQFTAARKAPRPEITPA